MNLILNDVFKALSTSWEKYLHKSAAHVSILEDKIYEQPADESRAPELWLNSSTWLKVERLVYTHQDVVKEVKVYLNSLFDTDPPHGEWLGSTLEDYERIEHLVQEDLVKPTQSLNDLMYKSVEIRDSRHSLQLGTSMWRLSWITFIFLPLTFLVSFFGMNVDTFQDGTPSIKWWFIVAVPMMLLVLALWYIVKHMLAQRRQDPLVRGTYEHLFHDFSTEHPTLWSRNGPREYVEPTGRVSRWKWYLLTKWFAPAKTIAARGYDQDIDGLGAWARVKRSLAIRWLPGITVANATKPSAEEEGTELSDTLYEEGQGTAMEPGGDFDAIKDALRYANRVGIAEAEPKIAIDPGLSPPPSRASRSRARSKRSRTTSPKQSGDGRPGSQSSGSCMITEEQIGSEGDGNESDAGASGGHGRPNSAPEGGRGRERGLGLLDVPGSDSQSHGPIGIDGRMM